MKTDVEDSVLEPQATHQNRSKEKMDTMQISLIFITIIFGVHTQNILENSDSKYSLIPDESSPCNRPCNLDTPSMECRYRFVVETYQSLSRACYDCPFNQSDCLRPHCIPVDGTSRTVTTINRSLPGPSIQVCEGDKIIVQVENHLAIEETTIHWHGHHQRRNPYMDGVPFLTQCPIASGTSFQYEFGTDGQIGTQMWHSHSGNQRGDGVYGALVIREPREKDSHGDLYDFDDPNHVMVITDWTQSPVHGLFINNIHNGGKVELTTLLVNGLGYMYNTTSKAGVPAARFHVEKGNRYRFRLINAEFMMCPIEVSVDNHTMTIISTDGFDIEPITVTSLVTYSGERFDFIINADQDIDNYWIRLHGLVSCKRSRAHQVAVLSYKGADKNGIPNQEPNYEYRREDGLQLNSVNGEMLKNSSVSIPELSAIQNDDVTLKEIPDKKFYIHFDMYNISNTNYFNHELYEYNASNPRFKTNTPQLNHISLAFQPFPLLSQRNQITPDMFCNESTVSNCTKEFCQCTHVLQVPLGEVVELILVDTGFAGDVNHPYHLHGYAFRVIGMERIKEYVDVETIRTLDEQGHLKRKLRNAPWKDTVTVPDGGYTIIRFLADNPGYWLFHCHIDFHASAGMALIFKIGEHEEMKPVPKNFPKCGPWKPSSN